jgi:RimJ/RimL family protein N-acetyltransferase
MHNPFLIGERIYLRALQHSDAALVATFFNDEEVNRWLHFHRPISPEMQAARQEEIAKSQSDVLFAIIRRETNDLIGVTGLHELNFRHRTAEFGIAIGERSAWGQGFGSEATRLQLKYAFETLNLHRVELDVQSDNERAIRAYEKVGFVKEGVKRQAYWGSGRWQDLVLMAALNPHH